MKAIQTFFIRAKHWQVFLLLFGLFFVGNVIGLRSMMQSPEQVFDKMLPIFAMTELLALCFALWLWCLGLFLTSLTPVGLRLNLGLFNFSVIYPPLYMLLLMALFQRLELNPGLFLTIIPLHLLAMFCLLYDLYFVAKSLALAERLRSVSLPDYIGDFFGLWIFPVGVWIIQPRVNRLYGNTAATLSS